MVLVYQVAQPGAAVPQRMFASQRRGFHAVIIKKTSLVGLSGPMTSSFHVLKCAAALGRRSAHAKRNLCGRLLLRCHHGVGSRLCCQMLLGLF